MAFVDRIREGVIARAWRLHRRSAKVVTLWTFFVCRLNRFVITLFVVHPRGRFRAIRVVRYRTSDLIRILIHYLLVLASQVKVSRDDYPNALNFRVNAACRFRANGVSFLFHVIRGATWVQRAIVTMRLRDDGCSHAFLVVPTRNLVNREISNVLGAVIFDVRGRTCIVIMNALTGDRGTFLRLPMDFCFFSNRFLLLFKCLDGGFIHCSNKQFRCNVNRVVVSLYGVGQACNFLGDDLCSFKHLLSFN